MYASFRLSIATKDAETRSKMNTVGGKSFGFVGIDIECKNISISGDIGGLILSTK